MRPLAKKGINLDVSPELLSKKSRIRYGGIRGAPVEVLTNENARLNKLLGGAMLDNTMLRDPNSKIWQPPVAKRQCGTPRLEVRKRRACDVIEKIAHRCAI
jgi:hypothetical protein